MELRFLGTGISQGIPVIGCRCPTCRSADPRDRRLRTSALLTCDNGANLQIDLGPDFREQMLSGGVERIDAVLLTHEHSDHVAGLDDIRPYNWVLGGDMPIYGHGRTLEQVRDRCPYAFVPPSERYPGAPGFAPQPIEWSDSGSVETLLVAGVEVTPLPVWHGRLPILGYRIGPVAYITDCSRIPESTFTLLKSVKVLVINALRWDPHPMHFTLSESLAAVERIGPERAYLTHLSHELGPVAEWCSQLPEHVQPAYDGLTIRI